jgi:phage-related protein
MTKVIYYKTTLGNSPAEEFILSLSPSQTAKILRILSYVEIYGLVTAIRHVKKLTGTPLWEIRILGQDSIRVLYATMNEDVIVILHGFIKKAQKTPPKEIEIAIKRLNEWKIRIKGG